VDTNSQTETSRVNLKPEAIIYVYIKKYGACLFLMSELVQLCALLVFFKRMCCQDHWTWKLYVHCKVNRSVYPDLPLNDTWEKPLWLQWRRELQSLKTELNEKVVWKLKLWMVILLVFFIIALVITISLIACAGIDSPFCFIDYVTSAICYSVVAKGGDICFMTLHSKQCWVVLTQMWTNPNVE